LDLQVLGCHGGTSREHRAVSLLVDGCLALDAGSLAVGLELEATGRVETVLVTHAHLDHVGELAAMADLRAQQDGPTLLVAGLPETVAALDQHFFNGVLWVDFRAIETSHGPTIELRALAPEVPVRFGGHTVLPIEVHHSVPSCGFIVDDGSTAIAYSGDTGPTRRFWEVVRERPDVRALITEVSFPDDRAELARRSGHLTPSSLVEQLEQLGGRRDLPVFVYGMKPVFVEQVLEELEALGRPGLRPLVTGERLTV
jgi:3',5'-cyclic-nucleotide phosphodiesterase